MSKEGKADKFKRERDQVIKERDLIIQENKELKIELAKRTEEFQSLISDMKASADTIIRRVQSAHATLNESCQLVLVQLAEVEAIGVRLAETLADDEGVELYDYDDLPVEIQDVIAKYSSLDQTYENCQIIVDALEEVGWTCDFDLGSELYDFRRK